MVRHHLIFFVADFNFLCLFCFQSMIWNPVRTLEPLGSAGTQAPDLGLVTHWRFTAIRAIVYRGQRRSCAWEVAAACGVPLCQGVWVRGQLLLLRFLSCLCIAEFTLLVMFRCFWQRYLLFIRHSRPQWNWIYLSGLWLKSPCIWLILIWAARFKLSWKIPFPLMGAQRAGQGTEDQRIFSPEKVNLITYTFQELTQSSF